MRFPRALLVSALLIACSVFAQQSSTPRSTSASVVPHFIRFTGQLGNTTGTVGITFTLHRSQQDNAALWIETQNVKLDATGKYTVLLGATKPEGVPVEVFTSGEAQWLSIRVEGRTEQPRVLLVSVPYALKAAEAETLAGHEATEFVTSEKLSAAVKEEVHAETTSGSSKLNANATPSGPTTFSGSTTDQIVRVMQTGAGYSLKASAPGTAILGTSASTTGAPRGVFGQISAPNGIAVIGGNSAQTGAALGVVGNTASSGGIAVKGVASSTSGVTVGVLGNVASAGGTAGVFQNTASGKVLSAQSGTGHTEVFSVDGMAM